ILGRDHVDLARTLNELASLHQSQNNFNLAETEYKRALSIRGTAPMAVADTLTGLALLHQARKQHAPAKKLLLQALSIKEEAFGPEAPQLVETLNKLGRIYESLAEVDRAIEFYERAIRFDTAKVSYPGAYMYLGARALEDSRYEQARKYLTTALENTNKNAMAYQQNPEARSGGPTGE
ncbi:MAG: tetratricopeptide repeat protein, partial [Leadbetterella sp.]|nr:tetratricopeptide repeat protein [Leadbetterella sp.]